MNRVTVETPGPEGETRVFHIDDDPNFADLTATVLEQEEEFITVETATHPNEALSRVADAQVDCVVSDYDMPEMDGIELLETIRQEQPGVPFILFTGKGSEEVASEAISNGVTDYLQKGTGTDQFELLCNRIENAVERYWKDQQLRQTRQRFQRIFEQSHDAIMIVDPFEDEITNANERACELLGYDYENLLSLSPSDIHPHEIDRFQQFVESVYDEETGWTEDLSCLTADGSLRPVHVSASQIEIGGQRQMLALIRELDEEQEPEEKKLYRTMLDHATDGIYLVEPETGELLDANATACRRLGYEREELIGKSVLDIAAPGVLESWDQHTEVILEGEWVSDGLAHRRKDGTSYPVALQAKHVVVRDDDTYIIAVVKDLSDADEYDS